MCYHWDTREKEQKDKVRLTLNDIENGNTDRANTRINARDGRLGKHKASCHKEINRERARIIRREETWIQIKTLVL